MTRPIHITDKDFDEKVLQSQVLVLVDFWADWCGPCKLVAPVLDEIAEEYGDKIVVAKLDVDANPTTATKYGVRSIPTLVLFKDGEQIALRLGALPKKVIADWLEKNL